MRNRSLYYFITGFILLAWILFAGCEKEYSYEGGDGGTIIIDTIPLPGNNVWVCPACIGQNEVIESKWSFQNNGITLCGNIDTAITSPERTAFTFFGPSTCSIDTGMVIGVFFNEPLDKDRFNFRSAYGSFFYYDNVGQTDIYISRRENPFTIFIESYIHQTRTVIGSFSGTVYRTDGSNSFISSGKFKTNVY